MSLNSLQWRVAGDKWFLTNDATFFVEWELNLGSCPPDDGTRFDDRAHVGHRR